MIRTITPDAVALAGLALVAPAVAAGAPFSSSAKAAHTLSSQTLQPASNLSVTTGCSLLVLGPQAGLTWTATPSTFASGYEVERRRGATLEATTTVTPPGDDPADPDRAEVGNDLHLEGLRLLPVVTSSVVAATRSTPGLCL